MFNALRELFRQKDKPGTNTGLQRGMLATDKRCLAAWRGILPQTNKRYSLVVRHLRRLPGEERAPFKVFPGATHDFSIWHARPERTTVNEFLLFHEQYDLGSEQINPYLSELAQWRSPDGYNAARRLVDSAAIKVGEKLAEALTTAKTRYLVRSGIVDLYYALAVEDAVLQFEHLRKPNSTPLAEDSVVSLGFPDSTSIADLADIAAYKKGDRVLIVGTKDKSVMLRFRQLNPHVNADGLIGRWGNLVDIATSSRIATVRMGVGKAEQLIKVPKLLLRPFGS